MLTLLTGDMCLALPISQKERTMIQCKLNRPRTPDIPIPLLSRKGA